MISFSVFAGGDKKDKGDPILFTFGTNTVNRSEFKYIYDKNNSGKDDIYSEASLKEYLD